MLLAHARAYPDCLSDDAFISFRYAGNLVAGHGLVFNPGQEPVEGYTNFLWTLTLAGAMGAGLDPELAARWLGLGAAVVAMLGAWRLQAHLVPGGVGWLAAVPPWLLAACSFFVIESVQGLETALMAALVVWALVAAAGGWYAWCGLLLGLATLTRPEGALVFAVLALLRGAHLLARRARPAAPDMAAVGLFAALLAGHLAFRLAVYGDWLPNTFHAKTGGGLAQVARGAEYAAHGLARLLPWLALAALLPWARTGGVRRRAAALTTGVWLAAVAGVVAVGGDFKPTFRFLVWSLPLLAALAGAGLAAAAGPVRRRQAAAAILAAVAVAATFVLSAPARQFAHQRQADVRVLREAARWLAASLPADAVLATGPAGALPYYTGLTTVDMWGLNDRAIGRRSMAGMGSGPAGHEKGDGAEVLARRPDIILFTSTRFSPAPLPESAVWQSYLYVSERELLALPEFHRDYAWRSARLPSTTLNYYARRVPQETPPS